MPEIEAQLVEENEIIATLVPEQGIRTELDTVYLYNPKDIHTDVTGGRYIEVTEDNVINNTMPISGVVTSDGDVPVNGRAVYNAIQAGTGTFVFEMSEASTEWVINHNLGKYPSVMVVDSAGTVQEGRIEYISENTCKAILNSAFKGKAYLN